MGHSNTGIAIIPKIATGRQIDTVALRLSFRHSMRPGHIPGTLCQHAWKHLILNNGDERSGVTAPAVGGVGQLPAVEDDARLNVRLRQPVDQPEAKVQPHL